ncbi:MAG: ligase [Phycisphaerales bacterium]|nr:ligase [Phycisphaerales bacterium]
MSSLVVEVSRIDRVQPHPNADALELAQIKGWQCVVPKGKYADGARVVYVPIDSLLPAALSDRLGITKYLSNGRVRCARLRGEPSFGVVMELEDPGWPDGTDVRERYGITKYVPPARMGAGDAEAPHPLFVEYTDVENLRNFPGMLADGEPVVATEKVHGTNCRVGMVEGEWMAGSMQVRRKRPAPDAVASSTYWFPTTLPGVTALVGDLARTSRQVILFGEVYGSKVQNLTYGLLGTVGFVAFDLLVDGRYLGPDAFAERCAAFGVPTAPVLYHGPFSLAAIRGVSSGRTTFAGADHIREGVVVRPMAERTDPKVGRVILKHIGDEYLLSKGISDADDV